MFIISYLLLSYFLSILGYFIYAQFIQAHYQLKQRKVALYLVIGLSMLLPYFMLQLPQINPIEAHTHVELPETIHNEPVLDPSLSQCYEQALDQDEFCYCEIVQQANLIIYHPNIFYNQLIQSESKIYAGFGIIAVVLGFLLFARLAYLFYLLTIGKRRTRTIDNITYYILEGLNVPVGSFYLWKPYVIWDTALNALPKEEQEAVFLHEIAHLKHKDTWQQVSLSLLQIVWFINPIYYLMKKEFDLISEYLADAFAADSMKDKTNYAELLLKLQTNKQFGFIHYFGASDLKKRIITLLNPPQIQRNLTAWLLGISMVLGGISLTSATYINQQNNQFEEYCLLHTEHSTTGQSFFCKPCLVNKFHKNENKVHFGRRRN